MNIIAIARSPKQLINIISFLNKNYEQPYNHNCLIIIENKGSSKFQDIQINKIISDSPNHKYKFIFNNNKLILIKILFLFLYKYLFKKYESCIGDPRIAFGNVLVKFIYFDQPIKVNIFDDGIVSARFSGKFSNKVFFHTAYYDLFDNKNNVTKFSIYQQLDVKPQKKLIIIGQHLYGKDSYLDKKEYLELLIFIINKFNKDYTYIPHRSENFQFLLENGINIIEPNLDINEYFYNNPKLIGEDVFGFFTSALIDLRMTFKNNNINFFYYKIDKLNQNVSYVDQIYNFYRKLNFHEIK